MRKVSVKRLRLSCTAAAVMAGFAMAAGNAHAYPDEPIELVVSYASGGISDVMARSFAHALEQQIDGNVVVQNRPGAAGIVGTNHVFNADSSGHTLLLARIATMSVAPALQEVPYETEDFSVVGLLATDPFACVTGTRKPYETLDDLKQAIEEKPGSITYSSSGVGSLNQFGALRLLELLDVGDAKKAANHVPYAGEGPALTAVAGGHIDFFCGNIAPILPQIQSGTVRGLVVAADERHPDMEDVPTADEAGVSEFAEVVGWSAIIAPPNTDDEAISVLGEAMEKIKNDEKWNEQILKLGAVPDIRSPEETAEFIRDQTALYQDMVDRLNLKAK